MEITLWVDNLGMILRWGTLPPRFLSRSMVRQVQGKRSTHARPTYLERSDRGDHFGDLRSSKLHKLTDLPPFSAGFGM
ncbi:hypothetical protein C5Y93_00450 [Blastopirellula marina]|uniref:Uncharacterized protein n=1 Tax=Blastopirellula marina TaxID=124 RepID=A0A2S8GUT4_9BACT|nr:hypothetical protein C5Y93_00450 [Blastopirellula marina]